MPDPPDIGKSFTVSLKREGKEILGMTIGGGAPAFPCIYVVQVSTEQRRLQEACSSADQVVPFRTTVLSAFDSLSGRYICILMSGVFSKAYKAFG